MLWYIYAILVDSRGYFDVLFARVYPSQPITDDGSVHHRTGGITAPPQVNADRLTLAIGEIPYGITAHPCAPPPPPPPGFYGAPPQLNKEPPPPPASNKVTFLLNGGVLEYVCHLVLCFLIPARITGTRLKFATTNSNMHLWFAYYSLVSSGK